MLDETIIRQLKKVNISVNAEKTGVRVHKIWKEASSADKRLVENVANVARSTIYRIQKTGGISAKLTAAISQTLCIDPYYIIGAVDEPEEFSHELLRQFLSGLGYDKLLAQKSAKTRKPRRKKAELEEKVLPEPAEVVEDSLSAVLEPPAPSVISSNDAFDNMTEDEMILLIRSMMLRAKAGASNAALNLEKLKMLLIS